MIHLYLITTLYDTDRQQKKADGVSSSADEQASVYSSTDTEAPPSKIPLFPMASKRPLPVHQRKFTPHSYFASTLRDVVAGKDQVVVLIPDPDTEIQLRKRMFKQFKENNIHDIREYERRLKKLISTDAKIIDVPFVSGLGKRYVHLQDHRDMKH